MARAKNIVIKDIDDLIFADYNPRQLTEQQYKHLKESIKKFGLIDPIIINKNKDRKNTIIGGHQRTRVAKTMGITEIPCVEIDLDLEKERELNIRLNKNTGGWNYDMLADLFDMKELIDFGFNEKSLVGLFDDIDYSILEDSAIDEAMEGLNNQTRKAIQIEFKLDEFQEAFDLYKQMQEKYGYLGSKIIEFFKKELKNGK